MFDKKGEIKSQEGLRGVGGRPLAPVEESTQKQPEPIDYYERTGNDYENQSPKAIMCSGSIGQIDGHLTN